MQTGLKIGIGIAAGAVVVGGAALALRGRGGSDESRGTRELSPPTSGGDDPIADHPVVDYPSPGDGTSPGDDPARMRVSGHIDPPAWFDDYTFDGDLDRGRLDVTIDPRGWFNDIDVSGRVDSSGWDVRVDPKGFSNDTRVTGSRSRDGWSGTVDRPGIWNDVRHDITESGYGAGVRREGRFDERLVPGFSEAVWRSFPTDARGGARLLEFDPPGWSNTTRVTIDSTAPAGVEATIASHLFDAWKTELEPQAEYPDPGYPGPTGPGDDSGYPTSPGDDW